MIITSPNTRGVEPLDARGDHPHEAASPGSGPVEPANELSVHQDRITLGDRIQHRTTDRGVRRRDREREETSACSGTEIRNSVT